MKLHCLGTAGYHPNETRQTSCYFLAEDGLVLDAGSGIFRLSPLIQTSSLDILLSHAHLDHTMGLTFLHDVLRGREFEEVRVWAAADKLAAIRACLFQQLIFPAMIPVRWLEVPPGEVFEVGASRRLRVEARNQEHPGGSLAYRIRWPGDAKTLIYATDTVGDTSAEAQRWMRAADLLVHECSFRDQEREWATQTGHCWTSRAAKIGRSGEVKRLLLAHINPLETGPDPIDLAQARAIFPETDVAADGDVIPF